MGGAQQFLLNALLSSVCMPQFPYWCSEAWLRFVQGPCTPWGFSLQSGCYGSHFPHAGSRDQGRIGSGVFVGTHAGMRVCSKVSQWDGATIFCPQAVGSKAQALDVPQLPP